MDRTLEGRNSIITGAGQGLGEAIANSFVAAGAGVYLCARTRNDVDRVASRLRAIAGPGQTIAASVADVSQPEEVEALVKEASARFGRLHILVNNAGVYGPMGPVEELDWRHWVSAVEINLLGSILTCRAVLPHFKKHGYGKIIQLSGGGATAPLPFLSAYAASKAGVARFTETLAEEVRGLGIDVNSLAPGALNTRLLDEILAAGPEKVGQSFYQRSVRQQREGGVPMDAGARLAVFLASAASDGISGKLISAVWDLWEELPDHREELLNSDIYTLRRIVPSDRGKDWGSK
jgi:NAD(P)-dependent dehydrogenase (short-subunit alcohol dehydrogenase family)